MGTQFWGSICRSKKVLALPAKSRKLPLASSPPAFVLNPGPSASPRRGGGERSGHGLSRPRRRPRQTGRRGPRQVRLSGGRRLVRALHPRRRSAAPVVRMMDNGRGTRCVAATVSLDFSKAECNAEHVTVGGRSKRSVAMGFSKPWGDCPVSPLEGDAVRCRSGPRQSRPATQAVVCIVRMNSMPPVILLSATHGP